MSVIISGDNGISDVDGSAGTPAIRGTDANTGIFFGADQVGVATNGVERVEFGNSETVFNDGGADVDFRVEGDTNANLLFVDASADAVGVGKSPGFRLDIKMADGTRTGGLAIRRSSNDNHQLGLWTDGGSMYFDAVTDNPAAAGNAVFRRSLDSGANFTESMRIDSSGNLLVGKTSTSGAVVGAGLLPSGIIQCARTGSDNNFSTLDVYSTGASAYRFYVGMAGTVYATNTSISGISDVRYKENIRDLDVGLDAVMQLRPRKFDWKEGKGQDTKDCRGFIAQEFEQVFPDLIDTWKDPAPEGEEPYKSVRQDLIPVLVKSIQELKAINDAQASRIETLEAKVAALEAK